MTTSKVAVTAVLAVIGASWLSHKFRVNVPGLR